METTLTQHTAGNDCGAGPSHCALLLMLFVVDEVAARAAELAGVA